MFKALILTQNEGKTVAEVRQLEVADLPEGEVLVDVAYSSLNYKDGLAVTGTGKIIRNFPMVPGIDLAGTVVESASDRFQPGDAVILTGWGVGERYWGGYAQKARVKANWLVPMPLGLDARKAMIIGTAGFTAMLCVMTLEDAGVKPDSGKVLVTGAAGGVGSIAVQLLAGRGYHVTAVTGRPDSHDFLRKLGAEDFISREEMAQPARPLESQRWAGAVDVVGGDILARVLAEMDYNGAVAACGLANSFKLNTTVMPFILRNVSLRGADSVSCPQERRTRAWELLAAELPESAYTDIGQAIALEDIPQAAGDILAGKVQGRTLIDLSL
ncbi:MDR family oxidoreductase [Thiothrix nivea]|uniref:Quinone oxidoreductase, YhdH/YhfP family n=1 Tax=Thiothrix nivea (strain ATCC 35100 / DSM 5205 / JP2) TaxID=870187 RepID=A0A656HCX8_THINJ|nr:MDR family oxidoreductase [Thiothrix nivea]EIJ35001.1 quinone oxidoreductase, YhdH/YhfP family [Thiothrix nivea DSM 5205]